MQENVRLFISVHGCPQPAPLSPSAPCTSVGCGDPVLVMKCMVTLWCSWNGNIPEEAMWSQGCLLGKRGAVEDGLIWGTWGVLEVVWWRW